MTKKPLTGILIASDVDGTIVPNDTIFDFFGKYGKRGEAEKLNAAVAGSDIAILLNKIARGNEITEKDFTAIADNAALFPGAVEFYKEIERLGAEILLLSASYSPIVERIAQRLGLKQPIVRATEVKWKNGVVYKCGRVIEVEEKQKALLEVIEKEKMQLKKTVGIADSKSDRFFMNAIKEAGGLCFWVRQPDFQSIMKQLLKFEGGKK